MDCFVASLLAMTVRALTDVQRRAENKTFIGAQVNLLTAQSGGIVKIGRENDRANRDAQPQSAFFPAHVERDDKTLIAEPPLISQHMLVGGQKFEVA